jgi:hypothetical protein
VNGQFQPGLLNTPSALTGEFFTEGTVVNWSPLPWESRFEFTLTTDKLKLLSSNFLGGFGLSTTVDFENDNEIHLSLSAEQYPLSYFAPFLRTEIKAELEGRLDLKTQMKGPLEALNFQADVTLSGSRSGINQYQTINLHVAGVYPTLRLSNSRVTFRDGQVMRFADQALEFNDLFDMATYTKLISGSDQDTTVFGDWEFHRPEEKLDEFQTPAIEAGFKYHLRGKEFLKFEMREDEHFVGVERKVSF